MLINKIKKKTDNKSQCAILPSQFVQNLPSPSTFLPEFYSMSPIQQQHPPTNPFLLPTSLKETGVHTRTEM